jgi:regulator of ribonuclease activity A
MEWKSLCISHTGPELCSMVGDQIAQAAFENNWVGIITNGYIRDIEVIQNIDIGLYAMNSYPKKTDKSKGVGKKDVPM